MNLGTLWNRRTFLGSTGMFAGMLFNARRAFGLAVRGAADARPMPILVRMVCLPRLDTLREHAT